MGYLEAWGLPNQWLERLVKEAENLPFVKIKFNIGYGEIINCWVKVVKRNDHYELLYDDNVGFDLYCKFDTKNRCFYGAG